MAATIAMPTPWNQHAYADTMPRANKNKRKLSPSDSLAEDNPNPSGGGGGDDFYSDRMYGQDPLQMNLNQASSFVDDSLPIPEYPYIEGQQTPTPMRQTERFPGMNSKPRVLYN
jgi:hypothetical protein